MELMTCSQIAKTTPYFATVDIRWMSMRVLMTPEGGIENKDYWDVCRELARARGLKVEIDLTTHRFNLPSTADFRPGAFDTSKSYEYESFREAWKAYAVAVRERYEPDVMEVWSEWTDVNNWAAPIRVEDYGVLFKDAKEALGSTTQVGIGGFFLSEQRDWWAGLTSVGVVEACDVVCLHPYSSHSNLASIRADHERLMSNMAATKKLYITEMGLPCVGPEGRNLRTCGNPNAVVVGLSDAEGAVWWDSLMTTWEPYCETVAAYFRDNNPPAGEYGEYWWHYVHIGSKEEILDVFRTRFPVS